MQVVALILKLQRQFCKINWVNFIDLFWHIVCTYITFLVLYHDHGYQTCTCNQYSQCQKTIPCIKVYTFCIKTPHKPILFMFNKCLAHQINQLKLWVQVDPLCYTIHCNYYLVCLGKRKLLATLNCVLVSVKL